MFTHYLQINHKLVLMKAEYLDIIST